MRQYPRALLPALFPLLIAGTCTPAPEEPVLELAVIDEIEPNNTLHEAQVVQFQDLDGFEITGTIGDDEDVDVLYLGTLDPGDTCAVIADPDGTTADLSVALFRIESDREIATTSVANNYVAGSGAVTLFETVIRRSGEYGIAIGRTFVSPNLESGYVLNVIVQRGAANVPAPTPQHIVLHFGGGSPANLLGENVVVQPFNPAGIDPIYAGQERLIRDLIVAVVRQNFRDFNVIVSTDADAPPAGPYSTVYLGAVDLGGTDFVTEGFGIALDGVDLDNQRADDNAIVFVPNFSKAAFGLTEPLDAVSLGIAIGNVASHEAGHLLGLHHVFDQSDIMNALDSPFTLLLDQRFKRSLIHFTVVDSLGTSLTQNADELLNDLVGSATMGPTLELPVGATPFGIAAGDLNADGWTDLAIASLGDSQLTFLINNGNGTFLTQWMPTELPPAAIALADLDFNGLADIITVHPRGNYVQVIYNYYNGLSAPVTLAAGTTPIALAVGDLDGDGWPDLVVANYESADTSVYANDGFGGLVWLGDVPTGAFPGGVVIAELSGGGFGDFAVTNTQDHTVTIVNDFTTPTSIRCGTLPVGIVAADLDGDGDADLATANALTSISTSLFLAETSLLGNDGAGTFSGPDRYFVEPGADGIVVADFDLDGALDLAVASTGDLNVPSDPGSVSILLNLGGGYFDENRVLRAGDGPKALVAPDLNNDGWPDLAVINRDSGTVSIYLNEQLQ